MKLLSLFKILPFKFLMAHIKVSICNDFVIEKPLFHHDMCLA